MNVENVISECTGSAKTSRGPAAKAAAKNKQATP